ncbi:hypothetical protein MBLNU230_g2249t1 [Neophaeotheca triangularis]
MENFNLQRMKEFISNELPTKMPRFPSYHTSMNPDDEETTEHRRAQRAQERSETLYNLPEPLEPSPGPKSNLDLVNECDNFPYYQIDTKLYMAHVNTYYGLYVKQYPETELGYVLPSVAAIFKGLPDWDVDDESRSLTLVKGETEAERSHAIAATTQAMRTTEHFQILKGWRDELYPVYGPKGDLLFSIERAASALFGVVTYGVHMSAYTLSPEDGSMKLWVPRRAESKQTYGGMLDNTVAGGIATGESPFESLVREAQEEASLPEELVRGSSKAVGTVTYFHIRDKRAGGETRLLQPEVQYVYDLELPGDVEPKPSDDEVAGFELLGVDEVREALRQGEFKPNCSLVLLDFFVRHGLLTPADEGYIELVARLHRRLEFPTV